MAPGDVSPGYAAPPATADIKFITYPLRADAYYLTAVDDVPGAVVDVTCNATGLLRLGPRWFFPIHLKTACGGRRLIVIPAADLRTLARFGLPARRTRVYIPPRSF